ncbi:ketopantoate reductase family protein [Myceligenerans crystallogenes]|uniref:2-dehydropantoate 2-reductase n=1 Tax=Myceligenerans crystallogenes TaxID=316335 RepID=A0ABP4ZQM0_9MICO
MNEPVTSPVAVVGPGAIGGLLAAMLQRSGHDVVLVAREATARHLDAHGIDVVTDLFGSWHADLPARTDVPAGARVLITVKADGVAWAGNLLRDAAPSEAIALLNGVEHMSGLRAAAPGVVVHGGAFLGQTRRTGSTSDTAPLQVRHFFDLLKVVVSDDAAGLGLVGDLAAAGADVSAGGSEPRVLWTKLRSLAALHVLTCLHDAGIGGALDRDPALTAGVLSELAAVTSAEGVPTTPADIETTLRGFPPATVGSLHADLAAGSEGELDPIVGAVVRAGARHGIGTPTLTDAIDRLRGLVGAARP